MADQKAIGEIFDFLISAYPTFKMENPIGTMKAYETMLADVPADALHLAAKDWSQSEKWFPTIAELRARAKLGKAGHWRHEDPDPVVLDRNNLPYMGILTIRNGQWSVFQMGDCDA
jgi:hypothetical protein